MRTVTQYLYHLNARHIPGQSDHFFACPKCGGSLDLELEHLRCQQCGEAFETSEGIPRLFWPNEWDGQSDVTEAVKAFYEETPFPDYNDFDSVASLVRFVETKRA